MGQSGELIFYSVREPADPKGTLSRLVELADPKCIRIAARPLCQDREWEEFLAGREGTPFELLPDPKSPEDFVRHYRDGLWLSGEMIRSRLLDRIESAVRCSIPPEVRGEFVPHNMTITMGFHDIFECAEAEEGQYVARAFVSVSFFGYSTPENWAEFRRRVFGIPEVQAVRRDLEAVTGPLESCIFWSI